MDDAIREYERVAMSPPNRQLFAGETIADLRKKYVER